MGFLAGKKALITGIASNRSIAYGIAEAMHRQGAALAFTYQNERLKDRVAKAAEQFNSNLLFPCDVGEAGQIEALFNELQKTWPQFDILVHAIAFAPKNELDGDYVANTTKDGFRLAHEISSWSFTEMAQLARPLLNNGGSLLTLSYLGAERTVTNYNVMGVAKASLEANVRYMAVALGSQNIRVNAISAGPIRTLAASGIADFKSFLEVMEEKAPLKRNVSIEEVGNAAAFLCSDLASGITGEILYVDAGYNIVGVV